MNTTTRIIHPGNLETFVEEFGKQLRAAIVAHPDKYAYPVGEADYVIHRMRGLFERGTYQHDTPAIRATAKALGLKPTRAAIEEFIRL